MFGMIQLMSKVLFITFAVFMIVALFLGAFGINPNQEMPREFVTASFTRVEFDASANLP